ncbi:MAG: aminomethyl-transferring glycine dehydrogenase [Phycisphaerae bacterium]
MVLTDETIRGSGSETSATSNPPRACDQFETFAARHIGPGPDDVAAMLDAVGCASLEALIDETIPEAIRLRGGLSLPEARSEHGLLAELRAMASRNKVFRSMIGMGYYDCILPPVIQRNVLENPGWYTQYTPYQAEIAQGRLEALLNFQTIVCDLTGLPVANASLLDEATAAAEAMTMCRAVRGGDERNGFFVADDCHPQTIAVVATRARSAGVRLHVGPTDGIDCEKPRLFGVLLQYPATDGRICDYEPLIHKAHAAGALTVVATDLLALTLLRPPGEFGADIAVGSSQRFGVPMGFGGPHAAFISTRDELKRHLPGRIVGVSKDAMGRPAYRLAIQTREQHIRREKATSNICTAQVLPAIMASMYAVYRGPDGLRRIAERVHAMTSATAAGLRRLGHDCGGEPFFDTLRVRLGSGGPKDVLAAAAYREINLRDYGDGTVGLSLDETTTPEDLAKLFEAFNGGRPVGFSVEDVLSEAASGLDGPLARGVDYLSHPVFHEHHCETEMLRYLYRLQQRDLSLATSMTPLGSCTMKLNGTSEMMPITWPEFARLHPFAPDDQTRGYAELFEQLEAWLAEITGFAAVSLQPNAGAQGEYTGLMVLRAYHEARGECNRDVCLIPTSAHGTNPASAVMAGLRVVAVACDARGNIDVADLKARAAEHRDRLAALMITYPSTHGVFEAAVREICEVVHAAGGQVYMDGANMNAQVGLCRPADIGADVCHLNLHKTFCIPHGGGGPGAGPIGVAEHLAPFLPGKSAGRRDGKTKGVGPVSAAPYGSASILPISWMYIALMGAEGLARASQVAILNANYMAVRLKAHYPILYAGKNGRVAHEFILDARAFKKTADVSVDDIAKRLMDYGFHAPTMSWPVPGTLMIEPTESESRAELDRYCDALIAIREEIRAIEDSRADRKDNVLKGAPHTADAVTAEDWPHAYGREQAAFPLPWVRERKFWPAAARIDNVWGDRNLFCTCPSVER